MTSTMRTTRKKDLAPRGVIRLPAGWGIRFVSGAGHVHERKISGVKSEAKREHERARLRVHNQPGWCPKAARLAVKAEEKKKQSDRITVQQYAEAWLRSHVAIACKPRTSELYRSVFAHHVFPAFGSVPLHALDRGAIRDLLTRKAQAGLARASLQNILIPLRAMLNAALDDGKIPGNPAVRLGRFSRGLSAREVRKVTALTADELSSVIASANKHFPDYADLIHVLAWTGLRLGEACGLQWVDLDVAGGFLEVRRTVAYRARRVLIGTPKSGQARRVDMPAALVARLRQRQSICEARAALEGRELSPWVFPAPTDDDKPLNAAHLRFKVWYRVLRWADLRGVRLHDLRHSYASLLLQAGAPMLYVKEQLGHSSIQVTVDLYGHIEPGVNREAIEHLARTTGRSVAGELRLPEAAVELGLNLDFQETAKQHEEGKEA